MRAWYFDETSNDPRDLCVLNDRFITQVFFSRLLFPILYTSKIGVQNWFSDLDLNNFEFTQLHTITGIFDLNTEETTQNLNNL